MKPSLHVKINQHLAMTPQLQHAIQILQLSSIELEQEIQQVLSCNPLLENEDSDNQNADPIDNLEDIENPIIPSESNMVENGIIDNNNNTHSTEIYETHENHDTHDTHDTHEVYEAYETYEKLDSTDKIQDYVNLKGAELTLQKHLLWQMELAHFSEVEHAIAWTIIDAISEDGYLTSTLEDIASSTGLPLSNENIEAVLTHIQQFDPIGVGARNLNECLTLQLDALPLSTANLAEAKEIVAKHLELLAKRDYSKLKSLLKISEKELQEIIKILTSLDPKPGRKISAKRSDYVIPDVIVRKVKEHYHIELNRDFVPKLRINPKYSAVIEKAYRDNNIILKEQLKEAKWFIKSLQTRQQTLLKVAAHIIETQKDFLDKGDEFMKPLTLQDVAKVSGLHESTVSRITNQKYILTPKGVYELKYFFTNEVSIKHAYKNTFQNAICSAESRDSKTDLTKESPVSAKSVRALLKKWIQNEAPKNPYSDQQLAEKLKEENIHIARRTVAKYRESLRIPASHERKMFMLKAIDF